MDLLPSSALAALATRARSLMLAAKAPSTVRAYRSDWRHFEVWCAANGLACLPAAPETVTLYLAALAPDHKPATLQRKLTSISKAHQAADFPSPATMRHAAVSQTLKGIRRTYGTAQPGKAPLLTAEIRLLVAALPPTLQGVRDRALLLMGFAGGFRRSELAAIDVGDISAVEGGLVVQLRRSKTDQEGAGAVVALPYGSAEDTCPVRAWNRWLMASEITSGPAFRRLPSATGRLDPGSIARIIKRAAAAAGLDPAEYAGHSLRAGFATQAFLNGAPEMAIMRQTRHKSLSTMRKYIRDRSLFRENAATRLGL